MTLDADVVVVGGGAAGLTAAVTLGRARRSVTLVDEGEQRNLPASEAHGLLALDGVAPAELVDRGRAEAARYGVRLVDAHAASARLDDDAVEVLLADGRRIRGRRLLVATGLLDELPELDGVRERWGRDVVHCPYCHGWEVRDRRIGVLGRGDFSVHQALLWRQWSDDVTLVLHSARPPSDDERDELAARGIRLDPRRAARLVVEDDRLRGVELDDGDRLDLDVVATPTRLVARAGVLDELGLDPIEHDTRVGSFIEADASGATAHPRVWVAGNVTDVFALVATAAADGMRAAVALNEDLVAEDVATARGEGSG